MDLDPSIAQKVANAARQVQMTKALMENARTFEERKMLSTQLERHEQDLIDAQILVRGTWGR